MATLATVLPFGCRDGAASEIHQMPVIEIASPFDGVIASLIAVAKIVDPLPARTELTKGFGKCFSRSDSAAFMAAILAHEAVRFGGVISVHRLRVEMPSLIHSGVEIWTRATGEGENDDGE